MRSPVEFAAAHEKVTLGIRANKAAFMIHQLPVAYGAKLPPVLLRRLSACLSLGGADRRHRQIGSRHKLFLRETPSSNKDFLDSATWTSHRAHTIVHRLGGKHSPKPTSRATMAQPPDKELVEEYRRRRRRERWNAFLTPLITLASVVVSIGLLMFFMRACQERFPQNPLLKPPVQPRPTNSSQPVTQ